MSTSVNHEPHTLKTWMRTCAICLAIVASAGLTSSLTAQTTEPAPSPAPSQAAHHARAAGPHHTKAAKPSPEEAIPPPAPPMPDWPINDQPKAASITWDSNGLKIDATNSSLRQILSDVATTTGMKVEGLGADERVYGDYGPGKAGDVLTDLLKGTGYNFIMMGQQAPGVPLQIVLSARSPAPATPKPSLAAVQNDNEDDSSDSEIDDRLQPMSVPPSIRPGFAPGSAGGPPRTPQQVMEEMQQRQQQMQQQLQQNPPENNQNNPPNQPNQPN